MSRPHEVELYGDEACTERPITGGNISQVYAKFNVAVSTTTTFQNTTGQNVKATINNSTGEASIVCGAFSASFSKQPPITITSKAYKLMSNPPSAFDDGTDFSFGDLVE